MNRPDKGVFTKKTALILPYISIGTGLFLIRSAWAAILLYHAGMLLFMIMDRDKPLLRQLFTGWHRTWAWMIPGSIAGGILIYCLWPRIKLGPDLTVLLGNVGLAQGRWILFLFYYALIHPPLEQVFWRGYLGHSGKTIHIRDIAFAGYHFFTMIFFVHWPWALLSFFVLTGTAWLWRQCVRETHGLLIPVLSHLAADISIIVMVNSLL